MELKDRELDIIYQALGFLETKIYEDVVSSVTIGIDEVQDIKNVILVERMSRGDAS